MSPTGVLLVLAGVFIAARTLFTDSQGQTLAGRLAGSQPSSSSSSSGSGPAATGLVTPSGATGSAADTHSPAFAKDILQALGAPQTFANVVSLTSWIQREGNLPSVDQFNPLDSTQPLGGSSGTNSANVQSYPNWATGVNATVDTLVNGRYPAIVAALKSGRGLPSSNPQVAQELSTWSGGSYTGI